MIALIHKQCGAVAYYYDHMPIKGERFKSKWAINVDGTEVLLGERVICPFCDESIHITDIRRKDLENGK